MKKHVKVIVKDKPNNCKVHIRCIDRAEGTCKYFKPGKFSWCMHYDGPHCRNTEAQEAAMLDHLESLALAEKKE